MKKHNTKRTKLMTVVLFVAAVALLLTSVVGGTYAALTYFSEDYRADMELFSIGVSLLENDALISHRDYTHADDVWDENNGVLLENMIPEGESLKFGADYPEVLTVKNSGTIDEYVRVRVYRYWTDMDGNKLNLDPSTIQMDLTGNGWLENPAERTAERTVLYYCPVLATGATSPAFNSTLAIDASIMEKSEKVTYEEDGTTVTEYVAAYNNTRFVVRAEVDAVQTHNAADAFKSAWGITAAFDANGNVTSVK